MCTACINHTILLQNLLEQELKAATSKWQETSEKLQSALEVGTSSWFILGLPYLQIQKRGHFGWGEGVSYFTSEFFVCEGAPIIKCNVGGGNSISNVTAPHFYSS